MTTEPTGRPPVAVLGALVTAGHRPAHEPAFPVTGPAAPAVPVPKDTTPVYCARGTAAPTLAQAAQRGLLPRYDTSTRLQQHGQEA